MMNSQVWQSLLRLESRDFVSEWFEDIHGRNLNARRAREIIACARQGREYFRSASATSFVVRPLLAFYGTASLCRALTLLHRRDAGEVGLKQGHGLETIGWNTTLAGDLGAALASIGKLRVRACGGLFSDLQAAIGKRPIINVYDRAIELPFDFAGVLPGQEVSLEDLLDRLPELLHEVSDDRPRRWVQIRELIHTPGVGATISVIGTPDHPVVAEYKSAGFELTTEVDRFNDRVVKTILTIDDEGLARYAPQILDTRLIRTRGGHPSPHLVSKFSSNSWLSQLSVTYMISYILGMLARYYPTQWIALMAGEKGDAIWPDIKTAQTYVEVASPELVLEAISNSLHSARIAVEGRSTGSA